MPIAGGLHRALERGRAIGCEVVQLFTSNPSQWQAKPLSDTDVRLFAQARRKTKLQRLLAHDGYLINLAAPDKAILRKSLAAFQDEIERCHLLGIHYLVTHMGSHKGQGETEGLLRFADSLSTVISATEQSSVRVLIETTAGQGMALGYRFEHLREVLNRVNRPDRMGVCLDTCHLFAAGFDLRTPSAYQRTMRQFGDIVGFDNLYCIHANDSRKPLGSRIDRHEHIGEGALGVEAFRLLVNDRRFRSTPIIIETPDGEERDALNLQRLRDLVR